MSVFNQLEKHSSDLSRALWKGDQQAFKKVVLAMLNDYPAGEAKKLATAGATRIAAGDYIGGGLMLAAGGALLLSKDKIVSELGRAIGADSADDPLRDLDEVETDRQKDAIAIADEIDELDNTPDLESAADIAEAPAPNFARQVALPSQRVRAPAPTYNDNRQTINNYNNQTTTNVEQNGVHVDIDEFTRNTLYPELLNINEENSTRIQ